MHKQSAENIFEKLGKALTEEEQTDLDRLLAQMNAEQNAALPDAALESLKSGEASPNDKIAVLAAMLVLYETKLSSLTRALTLLHKKSKIQTRYLDYLIDYIDF